jgi:hypothetical protein
VGDRAISDRPLRGFVEGLGAVHRPSELLAVCGRDDFNNDKEGTS